MSLLWCLLLGLGDNGGDSDTSDMELTNGTHEDVGSDHCEPGPKTLWIKPFHSNFRLYLPGYLAWRSFVDTSVFPAFLDADEGQFIVENLVTWQLHRKICRIDRQLTSKLNRAGDWHNPPPALPPPEPPPWENEPSWYSAILVDSDGVTGADPDGQNSTRADQDGQNLRELIRMVKTRRYLCQKKCIGHNWLNSL